MPYSYFFDSGNYSSSRSNSSKVHADCFARPSFSYARWRVLTPVYIFLHWVVGLNSGSVDIEPYADLQGGK